MDKNDIKGLNEKLFAIVRKISATEMVLVRELDDIRKTRSAVNDIRYLLQTKCTHEFKVKGNIGLCEVCGFYVNPYTIEKTEAKKTQQEHG